MMGIFLFIFGSIALADYLRSKREEKSKAKIAE